MKKILSIMMAVCIIFTSALSSVCVLAADQKPTERVKAQMLGAADYITGDSAAFTAENSGDFYNLIKSGSDVAKYKDDFIKSVKENLDANDGKIIVSKTDYDENNNWAPIVSYVESAAAYGAIILSFDALGVDYKGFKGYNIASSFSAIDVSALKDNPYLYRYSISAAVLIGNTKLAKALCDKLIADYYTVDKGMNYYGFSCDNTGAFIAALAPCMKDYKKTIDNAIAVLEKYKTENGYVYSLPEPGKPAYGANCNSTAMALAAYASIGNTEKAVDAYKLLCGFESATGAGIFFYTNQDKDDDFSATKDALFGLIKFSSIVTDCIYGHKYVPSVKQPTCTESGATTYTCSVCKATYSDKAVPATGHSFGANGYNCTVCKAVNPNYVLPKVTGLKVKSRNTKAVRITWNKVDGADYYIVYKYSDENKKYEYIAQVSATKNYYLAKDLKAGVSVKFRVAAVKGKKIGTRSSYLKTCALPKQGSIKSAKSSSKKKITVKFKSRACTGYEVQWSTKKDFSSNYKAVSVSAAATSKTITTAQSKRAYYVRVRAYTKAGGVKAYGKWSPARVVNVK